jgi:hypothetical protein
MYAINVALYTLLDQPAFDIFDSDFLRLTSAFSTIAGRSPVGRHLFHFFKLSVQSQQYQQYQKQGGNPGKFDDLPTAIREIFSQDPQPQTPEQRKKVSKSEGGTSYRDNLERNPRDFPLPGLKGMISEYEKLSVGKEERPHGYPKGGDF